MSCSCNSGKAKDQCCGPLLSGEEVADSPEALMRSRYSAFVEKNLDYVQGTTDPQALKDFDRASTEQWMNEATFTKLEVLKASDEGNKGTVEFKAHFTMAGKDEVHHEISKFRKQAGVWYFRDGKVIPPPPERN
jgi:SEC-C motif-containing protein